MQDKGLWRIWLRQGKGCQRKENQSREKEKRIRRSSSYAFEFLKGKHEAQQQLKEEEHNIQKQQLQQNKVHELPGASSAINGAL